MPGSGLLRSLQESDGVNLPRSGFVQQIVQVRSVPRPPTGRVLRTRRLTRALCVGTLTTLID